MIVTFGIVSLSCFDRTTSGTRNSSFNLHNSDKHLLQIMNFLIWPPFCKYSTWAVLALTHLPEVWHKENWFRTSENHERICLNKKIFFLNLAFWASRWKIKIKAACHWHIKLEEKNFWKTYKYILIIKKQLWSIQQKIHY
jgi:hypothetical protein